MIGSASPHAIEVQVDEPFQGQFQPDLLRQAALAVLVHQRIEGAYELAVVVTDDDVLHRLNKQHRGTDRPTDVLAFAEAFDDGSAGLFVSAPDVPRYLGDVIISYPRAVAQASQAGHSVPAELQLLVVHGILHLLGYDDEDEGRRAQMWQAQAAILRTLQIEVNPPL